MSLGARIYAELRGDRTIWMIVAVLAIFSLLIVYSSTSAQAYKHRAGDTESYLIGQLTFLVMGLFITYVTYLIHYEKYKIAAPWLMLITIPLLVYTLTMGVELRGVRHSAEIGKPCRYIHSRQGQNPVRGQLLQSIMVAGCS